MGHFLKNIMIQVIWGVLKYQLHPILVSSWTLNYVSNIQATHDGLYVHKKIP